MWGKLQQFFLIRDSYLGFNWVLKLQICFIQFVQKKINFNRKWNFKAEKLLHRSFFNFFDESVQFKFRIKCILWNKDLDFQYCDSWFESKSQTKCQLHEIRETYFSKSKFEVYIKFKVWHKFKFVSLKI